MINNVICYVNGHRFKNLETIYFAYPLHGDLNYCIEKEDHKHEWVIELVPKEKKKPWLFFHINSYKWLGKILICESKKESYYKKLR